MRNKLTLLFLLITLFQASGQIDSYKYSRQISGISDSWHTILINDSILEKVNEKVNDIRIFGITENKDTIETPYFMEILKPVITTDEVGFKIINKSHTNDLFYYTFLNRKEHTINQIDLLFDKDNFDLKVKLEGSENKNDWFTITEDYRILSIKNSLTEYQFSKLNFPESNYKYYRLTIPSNENPELTSANLIRHQSLNGKYQSVEIKDWKIIQGKNNTVITSQLKNLTQVCKISLKFLDTVDYYRPITIQYLKDSIKTEKGFKYVFTTLKEDKISSLETNSFSFTSCKTNTIRCIIHNNNNQPLSLESINAFRYEYQLTARFSQKATYFLCYGKNIDYNPNYDIVNFKQNIPKEIATLTLGAEKKINAEKPDSKPLLISKKWLWLILISIIVLLGWFSIKMGFQ